MLVLNVIFSGIVHLCMQVDKKTTQYEPNKDMTVQNPSLNTTNMLTQHTHHTPHL